MVHDFHISVLVNLLVPEYKHFSCIFLLIVEVNFMWAAHQMHHSSEDYNLTTALRQSVLQSYSSWVCSNFFKFSFIYCIYPTADVGNSYAWVMLQNTLSNSFL